MNKIKQSLLSVVIGLALAAGVSYAWTGPTASPPSGNTEAPINVGSLTQYKSGALGIGGLFRAYSQAIFDGNVGIGTASPEQKLDVAGDIKASGKINGIVANPALDTPIWVKVGSNLRYGGEHDFNIVRDIVVNGPVKQIKLVVTARQAGDWPAPGYEFFLFPPSFIDTWATLNALSTNSFMNNWILFSTRVKYDGNIQIVGWGVDMSPDNGWIDVDVYVSYQ